MEPERVMPLPGRSLRIVLLTSTERRHRYAAGLLARATNLVGILAESKPTDGTAAPATASADDAATIAAHFAARDDAERRLLGDAVPMPDTELRKVARGEINEPEAFAWVQSRQPDVVVLFGSGIVRPPLLDYPGVPLVNVHLGLSPYYRGSGTNFWPLYRGEPECVGATIHLAVRNVDAGAVLAQVRPDPEATDRAHELGSKTVRAAFEALPGVLHRYCAGSLGAQPQDLAMGTVYRRADFTAEAVRVVWRRFDEGMMDAYVADVAKRRARYPIIEVST